MFGDFSTLFNNIPPASEAVIHMSMIEKIVRFSNLFLESTEDPEELQKLISVAKDRQRWIKAHAYFDEVRRKNLKAIENKQIKLESLYSYIEICYKALFNLTYPSAPFDLDSPYFIIPTALKYCDTAGIDRNRIIEMICG